jgi:type III pantothenate kinase
MQSGIIFGYVSLVEGMLARIKAEVGDDAGDRHRGWADTIARETNVFHHIDADLTHRAEAGVRNERQPCSPPPVRSGKGA